MEEFTIHFALLSAYLVGFFIGHGSGLRAGREEVNLFFMRLRNFQFRRDEKGQFRGKGWGDRDMSDTSGNSKNVS